MNIFPNTPEVSAEDAQRLEGLGYLRSWNCLNAALAKHNPCAEDLKMLVILEITSRVPRQPIIEKLLVRVQKREREEIKEAIEEHKKTQ